MSTIPASQLVSVLPNVLSAGGSALDLQGLVLTQNQRVPTGRVLSLPNDGVSVARYFGATSEEAAAAAVYFRGFDGSSRKPGGILFAQYNSTAVSAILRGGDISALTMPQLRAIDGDLTILVNGTERTVPSVDLTTASSFSAAGALLQNALNEASVGGISVTGSIDAAQSQFSGHIGGHILVVDSMVSGEIAVGSVVTGVGVEDDTVVTGQLTGQPGEVGTYAVSVSQRTETISLTAEYGVLNAATVSGGTVSVGQALEVADEDTRYVTALGTGTGLAGTYIVSPGPAVDETGLSLTPSGVSVTYDSVVGGLVVTTTVSGAAATVSFATGDAAAALGLTAQEGASVSQGANPATPAELMTAVNNETQNWASFMHIFDPDGGAGSLQKQAFARWCSAQNSRYLYVPFDTESMAANDADAPTSLGRILMDAEVGGTAPVYDPTRQYLDAFVCGIAASLDFEATNRRTTFAFRGQEGLVAAVVDATSAANLAANGYNFYGAYATANQRFLFLQKGSVTGKFQWLDSYVNQIWLNNALQLALMNLLQQALSVPYSQAGYSLIKTACADPISAAVNFGAIRTGVTLSEAQKAAVNAEAGVDVQDALYSQGWYLQVQDASPGTRQARETPPVKFWYMDGGSIQQIVMSSVLIQ